MVGSGGFVDFVVLEGETKSPPKRIKYSHAKGMSSADFPVLQKF
jgi:hypothetical protein